MSEIADLVGEKDDAKFYRKTADEYIDKWQEYGISRDGTHAKLAYTWYGSWTTLYNLYADSLLCFHVDKTNGSRNTHLESTWTGGSTQKAMATKGTSTSNPFIPDKIYKMQSDWYHAVLQHYGLPLDSRHLYTKSDWEFFAAAVTSRKVRGEILGKVAAWVNETVTGKPYPLSPTMPHEYCLLTVG